MKQISVVDKHNKKNRRDGDKNFKKRMLVDFPFAHPLHAIVLNLGRSHLKNPESEFPD